MVIYATTSHEYQSFLQQGKKHRILARMMHDEKCEVCGRKEGGATMLLCDGCDHGYHLACLTPALAEVPDGEWFCPVCANTGPT